MCQTCFFRILLAYQAPATAREIVALKSYGTGETLAALPFFSLK